VETIQDSVVVIPAIIAAFIFGLKKALGSEITAKYKRYIPIVAMALGATLSFILAVCSDATRSETVMTTLQGIVIGAAAVGYREVVDKMKV